MLRTKAVRLDHTQSSEHYKHQYFGMLSPSPTDTISPFSSQATYITQTTIYAYIYNKNRLMSLLFAKSINSGFEFFAVLDSVVSSLAVGAVRVFRCRITRAVTAETILRSGMRAQGTVG